MADDKAYSDSSSSRYLRFGLTLFGTHCQTKGQLTSFLKPWQVIVFSMAFKNRMQCSRIHMSIISHRFNITSAGSRFLGSKEDQSCLIYKQLRIAYSRYLLAETATVSALQCKYFLPASTAAKSSQASRLLCRDITTNGNYYHQLPPITGSSLICLCLTDDLHIFLFPTYSFPTLCHFLALNLEQIFPFLSLTTNAEHKTAISK